MDRFVGVVELVDTYVSGAYGEIFEGSSPFSDILFKSLVENVLASIGEKAIINAFECYYIKKNFQSRWELDITRRAVSVVF